LRHNAKQDRKMLRKNHLKDILAANKQAIGTWSIINSIMVADVIASSGLDFLIIDAEHGCVSFETAQAMVFACESHGISPVMRVAEINESLILRALDIGIHGLQLPNIVTVEDAKRFVSFAKYPPIGTRGFSPYTRAGLYDFNNGQKLPAEANKNTLLIANVEGIEGLKNLEEISQVNGIDVIFLGLFDLSKSLGIPGDVHSHLVVQKLEEAVKTVHSSGKKIGTIASDLNSLSYFRTLGIDYLTFSVDTGILKNAYRSIVESFRT